jgi:hypothetical protein
MATLTTATGFRYYFQPSKLVAISDRDPSTQQATTCVYGLSGSGKLPIPGSPQQLISQLSVASVFFGQLTGPDGTTYWFNKSSVTSVSNGVAGHPGANSVVFAGGKNFFVRETLASAASSLGYPADIPGTAVAVDLSAAEASLMKRKKRRRAKMPRGGSHRRPTRSSSPRTGRQSGHR